mmetsp:Transcript_78984/g.211008  ORF Transcript_78984/g.211008 Transcript_78984/m.211008 type:complete len:249 (-) Transcript_78984:78-824(-)
MAPVGGAGRMVPQAAPKGAAKSKAKAKGKAREPKAASKAKARAAKITVRAGPLVPFDVFWHEQAPRLKALSNPTPKELQMQVAEMWRGLTDEQLSEYARRVEGAAALGISCAPIPTPLPIDPNAPVSAPAAAVSSNKAAVAEELARSRAATRAEKEAAQAEKAVLKAKKAEAKRTAKPDAPAAVMLKKSVALQRFVAGQAQCMRGFKVGQWQLVEAAGKRFIEAPISEAKEFASSMERDEWLRGAVLA